jgi:ribulose-5-phosphate 4-epimerase/fuculose-1-phosphate aldolase
MTALTDAPLVPEPEQVFAARRMPPLGVELTVRQKLACAFRILARHGWKQNLAGHITVVDGDTTNLLVNPWGRWWEEVQASDICVVSSDGEVLDGPFDVTPAIFIHTELHRRRPDARVAIHNHPLYATVHAGLGVTPIVTEQTGCMFAGEMALYNEYTGGVDNPEAGRLLAEGVGDATAALLVNHGALVTGRTIEEATYRAVSFERVCQLSYLTMMTGRDPIPIDAEQGASIKAGFGDPQTIQFFWNGAVRLLLKDEPQVLD